MIDKQFETARVLVVDDNERNLVAMAATLEPLGEELVFARSGQEALKALLRGDFALILLDVQMPQMSGIETAALIRMRERTRLVPIIFFTAFSSMPELVAQGYSHGAVDFLVKPVAPDILRAKVWFFVELWRRGRRLEQTARELSRSEAAQDEAKESAEFERRMLGIVSHDLRGPLTAVKMTVDRLLKDTSLDASLVQALSRVLRSATHMEKLTDLFLDVTRARVGGGIPVTPQRTDLRDVCQTAVEEIQAGHPDRVITLLFDDGDGVGFWDAPRLQQVLSNLLANAIKHGLDDRPITVKVTLTGPLVAVAIHNDGKPIPPQLLSNLFEPFSRGVDPSGHGSLGLGLYIVRDIVRRHGGEVSARSTEAEGTTFSVVLPRVPPKFDETRAAADAR